MNTRPAERLAYRDLARQQARVTRRLDLNELPRLSALVERPRGVVVEVLLEFGHDPDGRIRISGSAAVECELICHRCAETVFFPLGVEFDLLIQTDPARASELARSHDVLVLDGGPDLSPAEVVEDELLLALPDRLCGSSPCERMPQLAYPAIAERDEEMTTGTNPDNPFLVLERLKRAPEDDR